MKLVTSIEECNLEEIRFLREGDYEYQIKKVEKFMNKLEEYSLFEHQEAELLKHAGLEEFHKEIDLTDTLNLLDRLDVKVLQEFSTLIN